LTLFIIPTFYFALERAAARWAARSESAVGTTQES